MEDLHAKYPGRPTEMEKRAVSVVQAVAVAAAEEATEDPGDRFASVMATLGLAYMRICESGVRVGIIPLEQAETAMRDHYEMCIKKVRQAAHARHP